jgi:ABC-type tungstate transport system permease subunit
VTSCGTQPVTRTVPVGIKDRGLRERDAITSAVQQNGYTFWSLTPFLIAQRQAAAGLEPMVLEDPLLQRIMVSIRVLPKRVSGVNTDGASAFEQYLLEPRTEARIRAFRYPGIDQQIWWPAEERRLGLPPCINGA